MSDSDPHLVRQNCYLQMVRTMDQLTGDANLAAKDRIAVVIQVLRAYSGWLQLEKADATAVAGTTARKFESAFKTADAAGGRGAVRGPAAANGDAAAESGSDDADDLWRGQL